MSVRLRPIEERLKVWNFPLYPINRRATARRTQVISGRIPVIEGRKLRVQGKADPAETSCLFCSPQKSRPNSASHVLVHPGLASQQRFNENQNRPRRLALDSRRMPLAMECLQTNLNNHTIVRTQQNSKAVVSRTVLDHDRYLNRTMSLPILLEKKSVEIKPRYEPRQSVKKRSVQRPKEEMTAPSPNKPASSAQSTASTHSAKKHPTDSLIDHSISVTITDKRTRSVVRASSAASVRSRVQQSES